jgi:ArsR family transcriptional regulator
LRTLAQFFKTLADESRLQILWLLSHHGELCVCDIVEALQITQSKASRHLTTLKHAGLVTDRRAGAWSYYSLVPLASALERAQLKALMAALPAHPAAAETLENLATWLADSKRGDTCGERPSCGCNPPSGRKRRDR